MRDEGYIKFVLDFEKEKLPFGFNIGKINNLRTKLHQQKLIGVYPDGIGFGNISCRLEGDSFLITGSATGQHEKLDVTGYAIVDDFKIAENWLHCKGCLPASSESLSHGALYLANEKINSVIHIHNLELWEWMLAEGGYPLTPVDITFGTPEMALAIQDIGSQAKTPFGVLVMGGHREGVIAYGTSPQEAYDSLQHLLVVSKRHT